MDEYPPTISAMLYEIEQKEMLQWPTCSLCGQKAARVRPLRISFHGKWAGIPSLVCGEDVGDVCSQCSFRIERILGVAFNHFIMNLKYAHLWDDKDEASKTGIGKK